jgi:hypothetical protein
MELVAQIVTSVAHRVTFLAQRVTSVMVSDVHSSTVGGIYKFKF